MKPAEVRQLFPAAQRSAYLCAAAASPLATTVAAAAQAHLEETRDHGDVGFARWLQQKEALRAQLSRLVNAPTERVGFTASTSMGFQAVAELWWRRGIREVLSLEGEFPSTTVPFLNRGFRLNVVKPRPDGAYRVEDLEVALRPTTQAVAVSAVQFASGFRLDLAAVATLCSGRHLSLAVNAAQAAGQIPLDVEAWRADFLCAPSHKWLMGGSGVGLFYAREGWLEEHGLPWAGWLAAPDEDRWNAFAGATKTDTATGFIAEGFNGRRLPLGLENVGSFAALASLQAGVELVERTGIEVIAQHNAALQSQLRAGLRRLGFHPNAPDDQVAGICVVSVDGAPLDAVRALMQHGVVTTPRGVGLRIATHVFNDASDVERCLHALPAAGVKPA